MKKYFYIILLLLVVSCYEDKGNYDYREINELTGEVGNFKENYYVYRSNELTITPDVKFSQDGATLRDYRYEWKAVSVLDANKNTIVGTEKNLKYTINLEEGVYDLYLRIKDNSENLLWMISTKLNVSSPISRGYLLIGDNKGGHAQADMIAMPAGSDEIIVMNDLFKDNGLPAVKGGLNIMHTGDGKSPKLWYMTKGGSYFVDTKTFKGNTNNIFQNILFTSMPMPEEMHPIQVVPRAVNGKTFGNNRYMMCDNGYVFTTTISAEFYANPLNRLSSTSVDLFRAAPFTFYMYGNDYGISALLLYDTDNDRFVGGSTSSGYLKVLTDKAGDQFSWKQAEGTELVYGENTVKGSVTGGNSFALMKRGDDYLIYEVFVGGTPSKKGYYEILPLATDFSKAELFAFSSNRTILFYTIGSKLYAYDYNKGAERCQMIKDFGDIITMIKFDIQSGINYNALFVGTYNSSTGGTFSKYVLGTNPNTIELALDEKAVWKGLCKIKNMDWRNA